MCGAVGLPAQVTGKFRQEEYRCVSDTLSEPWLAGALRACANGGDKSKHTAQVNR